MACSFSDFPVFVLHFGHPKPQALSANFTMVADAIGDAISGLGLDVPEGASLLDMAELISSHLYFPVDNQETGAITLNIVATGRTYIGNVEFEKPFLELPNVSLTGDYNSQHWLTGYQVISRSTTGFSWKFTTYAGDGRTVRITVSWTATGKRAVVQ